MYCRILWQSRVLKASLSSLAAAAIAKVSFDGLSENSHPEVPKSQTAAAAGASFTFFEFSTFYRWLAARAYMLRSVKFMWQE
jgi:hypothetical protein